MRCPVRYFMMLVAFEAVLASILFGSAGRIDLPWFWALISVHTLVMGAGFLAMGEELRRARTRRREGGVDRVFRSLMLVLLVIHLVVAGLDAGRLGWSPALSPGVHAAGLAVYLAGLALSMWAVCVNRFFEPTVRIQADRGQYPITNGPYHFVRHPG